MDERNMIVTADGARRMAPEDYGFVAGVRRALTDNIIHASREAAVRDAEQWVASGDVTGACVWQSGIGDWLVNGWR